jgi:hypothetical protein
MASRQHYLCSGLTAANRLKQPGYCAKKPPSTGIGRPVT